MLGTDDLRQRFPSLQQADSFIFFDNAAGAQIPDVVVSAVTDHLLCRNVQRGGPYARSREVDRMIAQARGSVAAFVNATGPDEIAFGLNATSFIRSISLAIGQSIRDRSGNRGDRNEVVVSELDHEANIATWLALERFGARIVWWRVRDDGRLYPSDLESIIGERTRIIACAVATNALGTLVDVGEVARVAHAVGAEVFLDAVHYAPHGPIDVQQFGCDYMVCSGYKVFAPHMGFVWCRREAVNALPTFREHFIPDVTPDKLESGTYAYENVAGMDAAIGYLASLGDQAASRTHQIRSAMTRIKEYEQTLTAAMLDVLQGVDNLTVYGVTDRARLGERVPTFAFSVDGKSSATIAERLGGHDVGVRSGHMYSPRLLDRLGLLPDGVVRASLVHYNTLDEIARFGAALGLAIAAA